jgi:hypothetical protein
MGRSAINVIEGLKIVAAEAGSEGLGLLFENQIKLVVFNAWELLGASSSNDISLVGSRVQSVREDDETVLVEVDLGVSLRISLHDSAYSGPEALQLIVPGKPIVVWN